MSGKYEANRRGQRKQPPKRNRQDSDALRHSQFILTSLIALAVVIFVIIRLAEGSLPPQESVAAPTDPTKDHNWFWEKETEPPTEPPTEAPSIVSTATISATGDVLMHMPVVNTGYNSATGTYDFTGIFKYLDDYSAAADYAVANLETTLAGTGNGYNYSGYPCFNCPDDIAEALKEAGFDMLLTANNHCYDTRTKGLTRTLEVSRALGFDTLGTYADANETKYTVENINGIQVGMLCYSYATADDYPDRASMNGILTGTDAVGLINYFDYDKLTSFYTEVQKYMAEMEAAGAEAFVMYIHWGEEYQLRPNTNQTTIAQRLCDLGIDVIVGGHPHVVQPVELLSSTTDPDHKTVCLYSMGNAVSNQRRENMNMNTGHTEDGVLFSFTFAEYADGTVRLDSVDLLPTWVHMGTENGERMYRILPLDQNVADWGSAFNISASVVNSAQSSYERTMALVEEGLTASNEYLTAQREAALASGS